MVLENWLNEKENCGNTPRRSMKGRKSSNAIVNTSFLDKENIGGLNDQLTEYIDYVRTIESTNETLKNEKQHIVDSFERDITLIKTTYGEEVDSLRQALDDVTASKSKIMIENKSLLEDHEILTNKLKNETYLLNALKNDFCELQENLSNYRKKLEAHETLKQEYNDILIENNKNKTALKSELCKNVEMENRMVTLSEEIEFYKKLSKSSKIGVDKSFTNVEKKINENFEAKIQEEVEIVKNQLTEDFEHYKEELVGLYEEKYDNLSEINEKSTAKCNIMYNENKKLKKEIEELQNENFERTNQIAMLNKRISNFNEFIESRDRDNENHLKDILEENNMLKKNLEIKIHELSDISNEKITIEKELYLFRSLLEGEQTRCNITEATSPKRRKINKDSNVDNNFDITAYSNDRIKMFCDDNYNGDFIQLLNDTNNSVSINEWKIEIAYGDSKHIYCFPNRFVEAKTVLKVWKQEADIIDDENNIRMNVGLPHISECFQCKLTNDMDEIEASFELRKVLKRKFLKANVKHVETKEKCAIM